MARSRDGFNVWDWLLFAAMLLISAGIGIFYAIKGYKHNTTKEFLMGGRQMQLVPIAISILVSTVPQLAKHYTTTNVVVLHFYPVGVL
jgi:sodium-coupled monocarboxylate transporter 8/12